MRNFIVFLLLPPAAWTAAPLSVEQAVSNALAHNPSLEAASEAKKSAGARVAEARGGLLPKVDYNETWERGNNPVFVFGALLTQGQFRASNFDLGRLNSPAFLDNFQSQVTVEQNVFDAGLRRSRIRAAELGRDLAGEAARRGEMDTIQAVLRAYYDTLLSKENLRAAGEAVRSAEADLNRAANKRAAGLSTDADVLSIRVHLAAMEEIRIRRGADAELARATLNQAMGLPLDAVFDLSASLQPLETASLSTASLEAGAIQSRPETRGANLATRIGETQAQAARAAMLPQFFVRAGVEADRQRFFNRGGTNWMAAAGMRWNLFEGFSGRARQDEALYEIRRSRAQARSVESAARLDVRSAALDLASAGQRIEVERAAVAMAEESLRIIGNRYQGGLAEVTELLRGETALLDTKARALQAVRDQRMAAVALEAARGRLTKDSDVVRK